MPDENTFAGPQLIQDADELYETLMASIEPDLTLQNLPRVIEEMKTDSEEKRAERVARYNAAFAEYDSRLSAHKKAWDKAYAAYHRGSVADLYENIKHADEQHMADVEQELDSQTNA